MKIEENYSICNAYMRSYKIMCLQLPTVQCHITICSVHRLSVIACIKFTAVLRNMRKSLLVVVGIVVCLLLAAQLISTAPFASRKSLRTQLNPNYMRAMAAYKRLESKLPREELQAVTTIGILNGAAEVERHMEQHLIDVVSDLLAEAELQKDKEKVIPKIDEIERQLWRDQRALQILTSAMDLATKQKGLTDFKSEMRDVMYEVRKRKNHDDNTQKPKAHKQLYENNNNDDDNGNGASDGAGADAGDDVAIDGAQLGKRIADLRKNIQKQMDMMKDMVEHKIEHTLDYLIDEADDDGLLAKASHKVLRKRQIKADNAPEVPAEIRMIDSILTEADFRNNLVENGLEKRKDEFDSLDDEFTLDLDKETVMQKASNSSITNSSMNKNTTTSTKPKSAKQEELDTSDNNEEPGDAGGGGGGGGGLVGLIGSLSGGEGGSDVGALIGALTGLVSTLFGPGGLDLESLISTGTSLISGLLAGNKNFGTVLGVYVGTAFDGLSGGGGAVNNGQFIGNFLGTVVASLSADPEDDDEPPKPFLFAQNLINSFLEAKNRKGSDEDTEDRHDNKKGDKGGGGSDSGGFIKQIVAHVVSNAISVILNASLGASGGASQASHTLFSGSSSQHGKH